MMKMHLSGVLPFALLAPAIMQTATSTRSPLPVAYVSVQKITAESTDAKTAAAKLETMRQEKAREVTAKQKALEATRQQLVEAGGVFQRSRRVQLQADERKQQVELQRFTQQAQADFQNLQRQLQGGLRDKITATLDRLAKRRGLQLVLNEDAAVVWATPGIDLTSEVVSSLNAAEGNKETRQ